MLLGLVEKITFECSFLFLIKRALYLKFRQKAYFVSVLNERLFKCEYFNTLFSSIGNTNENTKQYFLYIHIFIFSTLSCFKIFSRFFLPFFR